MAAGVFACAVVFVAVRHGVSDAARRRAASHECYESAEEMSTRNVTGMSFSHAAHVA